MVELIFYAIDWRIWGTLENQTNIVVEMKLLNWNLSIFHMQNKAYHSSRHRHVWRHIVVRTGMLMMCEMLRYGQSSFIK